MHESAKWNCHITVAKFHGEWTPDATPYEVDEYEGNLLMHGGVSNIWRYLIGDDTATETADQTLTFFDEANAAIGVGDSTTAEAATQTDLQAATNKLRKAMDPGYPDHTDGTAATNAEIVFRSTFGTSEANFAWEEAGVFNSATAATGRMLNRKVQSMGTKTSASSWQITFTIDIA